MSRWARRYRTTSGFTTVELILAVVILSILLAIVRASMDTLRARARASRTKADMDAIAQAAYTNFSYNGHWSPIRLDSTMPRSMGDNGLTGMDWGTEGILRRWPSTVCPGQFYTWENYVPLANIMRVGLRRNDGTAVWSYCVDVGGGGDCGISDPLGGLTGTPLEISTTKKRYLWCDASDNAPD